MISRYQIGPRLSHAVEFPLTGSMVATAGEVADDLAANVTEQTAQVLAKIDRLLADCGADKKDIVVAYIWLSDISDFDAMNHVWEAWLPENMAPTRACVEAKMADPRIRVEIQVFAVKP